MTGETASIADDGWGPTSDTPNEALAPAVMEEARQNQIG